MNYFSKRTASTIQILSFLMLAAGITVILLSDSLVPVIFTFLEKDIFHRSFEYEKWAPTIITLLGFPVFLVILFNAVIFVKYSDRAKIIFLSSFTAMFVFLMIFCWQTRACAYMDSDMASEILLGKECILQKSLLPRTWYYSTEIRLLNTQLITAPLFLFLHNWITIKTITAFFSCLILFISTWYLLNKLCIRTVWIKLLCGLLALCPCSLYMWTIVHYGNYYIPHMVLSFLYIGLFFTLMTGMAKGKKDTSAAVLFLILAFVSGVTTIRYIMIYEFPLALTVICLELNTFYKSGKPFNMRTFCISNRKVFYSITGLVLGCAGYFFNSNILSHIYHFSEWNSTAFHEIGDISFTRLHRELFLLLGYQENVSALTPAGIINVLLYVGFVCMIICIADVLRKKVLSEIQRLYLLFSLISLIFTGFLYINLDYDARYFIMEFIFFIPCIAIFLNCTDIHCVKRYLLGVSWSVILAGSAFSTMHTVIVKDTNTAIYPVVHFLESKKYTFGYAMFWNANVVTFLTNGRIEMANLAKNKTDHLASLKDRYALDKWLTSSRFDSSDYKKDEKVFLLVTEAEYNATPEHNLFKNGTNVFSDGQYRVYEFASPAAFRAGF